MFNFKTILSLGRIKFLLYSPILYTLGALIAAEGFDLTIEPKLYFIGLLFVWVTHLMTHYFNEYYDFEADQLNINPSPWTGGSRVLVNGLLEPKVALRLARLMMAISILLSLLFPNWHIKIVAWIIIFFSWQYSAMPLYLEGRALGEFTVTLVLNILVPILGLVLQAKYFSYTNYLWVLLPLAIVEYVRMMVMNMPDRKGDVQAGKLTLIVRIGMPGAVRIHLCGTIFATLSIVALYFLNINWLVPTLMLVTMPLSFWVSFRLLRGDWQNRCTMLNIPFWASTHNGFMATACLIAMLLIHCSHPLTHICMYPVYLYLGIFSYLNLKQGISNRYFRKNALTEA